jgi:hypothetical protein
VSGVCVGDVGVDAHRTVDVEEVVDRDVVDLHGDVV